MLLSPFTTLLRLHVVSPNVYMEGHVEALLRSIIEETTILNQDANHHRLGILVLSLQDCAKAQASDSIFEFIDNCLLRCSRKPVKYYDDLTALVSAIRPSVGVEVNDCKIDLLLVTILDQWPFLVKSAATTIFDAANSWLVRYMGLLMHTGSNMIVLSNIRDQFMDQVTSRENRSLLEGALREPAKSSVQHELRETKKFTQDKSANLVVHLPKSRPDSHGDFSIPELPAESEDYSVLRKWIQKETPEAIRDGAVGQLILCLCSKHEEIRKQAIVALQSFSGGLEVRLIASVFKIWLKVIAIGLSRMATDIYPHWRSNGSCAGLPLLPSTSLLRRGRRITCLAGFGGTTTFHVPQDQQISE